VGLREKKKQQTRQNALKASAKLFQDQGFAATSMDQIATKAMVSRTTLFNYFSSKDAIVLALAEPFENSYPKKVREICSKAGTTAQRIEASLVAAAEYFMRHRALNEAIYLELKRIRSTEHEANRSAYDGYHSAFSELLDLGMEQGDVRIDVEKDRMSELLYLPITSGIYRIFNDGDDDIDKTFRSYATLLTSAITIGDDKAPTRKQR
jgi:AcrR family transcriptional regulator